MEIHTDLMKGLKLIPVMMLSLHLFVHYITHTFC